MAQDIREILNALDENDRHLYAHLRTTMRRTYLEAVNDTVGICNHAAEDDAFLDLIDIKLAILFDRAGKFDHARGAINEEDAQRIEEQISEAAANVSLNKTPSIAQRTLAQYAPKPSNGNNNGNHNSENSDKEWK